jgi:DNA mismatch repair protein MutS2
VRFEDVLTQLDAQRQAMEKEKEQAARLRREMEESTKTAREYRQKIEAERAKAVEKAQAEARAILNDARQTADQVFQELNEMRRRQEKEADWQQTNDQRAALRHRLNQAEDALGVREEETPPPPTRPAAVGDTVELVKMGAKATVLSVSKDGVLQLQAGILKITARQDEVRVVEGETQSQKEAKKFIQRSQRQLRSQGASSEVDLRGMMTDEAVNATELFLDTAMLAKLTQVTIIHGKGTGAVRRAVRDYLKRSKYVKSFRPGAYGEGEDGVTIVELK